METATNLARCMRRAGQTSLLVRPALANVLGRGVTAESPQNPAAAAAIARRRNPPCRNLRITVAQDHVIQERDPVCIRDAEHVEAV